MSKKLVVTAVTAAFIGGAVVESLTHRAEAAPVAECVAQQAQLGQLEEKVKVLERWLKRLDERITALRRECGPPP